MIEIVIPGNPIPKGRPRHSRHGATYTPQRTRLYELHVRNCAEQAMQQHNAETMMQPVKLTAWFYRSSARNADWDNLAKALCDGINGIVFDDDSQIVDAHMHKRIDRDNPRTVVRVEPVEL